MELPQQVALVTGGASGIGRAVCRTLAARDVQVVVADIDEPGAWAVAEEIGGAALAMDAGELAEAERAVAFAEERFGRLDHVHLNAGISTGCGLGDDFDLVRYRRAMAINLDGVAFGLHAARPALLRAGGGSVVATASLAGLTAVPMDPIYAGNKHAVVGIVRSIAPVFAAEGIRVNAICPGFTESAIIADFKQALVESGVPIIETQVVADAVVELLEGETSGECVFVQSGRPPSPFAFRNIPGPRPLEEPAS